MTIRLKTALFWIVVLSAFAYGLGWQLSRSEFSFDTHAGSPRLSIREKQPPNFSDVDLTLFWQVWDMLDQYYIDKTALDREKMVEGAISGMVSALGDPYTAFLPPQQNKTAKEELEGSFEGVGIQLGFKEKRLVVIAPLTDMPAFQAGVKAGDYIAKINGKETGAMTLPEAVSAIRGPKGSTVVLTIIREGEQNPRDFSVIRDTIRIKSVEVTYQKDIALIKLTRFADGTQEEWNDAVQKLLVQRSKTIVLDVRNNPGGYLDASVHVAADFFEDGVVVQKEHSSGKIDIRNVKRPGRLRSIPVVVLVNKGSASAAEIVAGAIQDRSRGKLVGEQSFGKGSIQEVRELSKGAGIHITTEKWLLPSGKWINGTGLTPDIVVAAADNEGEDVQLEKAVSLARTLANAEGLLLE